MLYVQACQQPWLHEADLGKEGGEIDIFESADACSRGFSYYTNTVQSSIVKKRYDPKGTGYYLFKTEGEISIDVRRMIPPDAAAGQDQTLSEGQPATLDGSGSSDDGSIVSYLWREGETVLSSNLTFTHLFSGGVHSITLKVTDDDGAEATDTISVTITGDEIDTWKTLVDMDNNELIDTPELLEALKDWKPLASGDMRGIISTQIILESLANWRPDI